MKLVFVGLSLSSAWGNGHATTYRALLKGLAAEGVESAFLERDAPWYAARRDLAAPDFCDLVIYPDLAALERQRARIAEADAVIVGSYVPDGPEALDRVFAWARGPVAFYDIDTPITLAALAEGRATYLRAAQIPRFAVYLSFTGGPALDILRRRYGARAAAWLPCGVDPQAHAPATPAPTPAGARWALSYLGTYAADRQDALERLLFAPARLRPEAAFAVAGPLYPDGIAWPANVRRFEHVAPGEHAAFYAASALTLNLTRADMRALGHSPSVRLFEAAAAGAAILTDPWDGLAESFAPETEVAVVETAEQVLGWLDAPAAARAALAAAARRRALRDHTGRARARSLLRALAAAAG